MCTEKVRKNELINAESEPNGAANILINFKRESVVYCLSHMKA